MADLESENSDEQVRQLLRRLDDDAAAVDLSWLAKMRDSSLGELDDAAAAGDVAIDSSNRKTGAGADSSSMHTADRPSNPQHRGKRMLALATRAAIAATTLAITGLFLFFSGHDAEAFSLGRILDTAQQARTLHLQVVRNGDVAGRLDEAGVDGSAGRPLPRPTGSPTARRCGRSMKTRISRAPSDDETIAAAAERSGLAGAAGSRPARTRRCCGRRNRVGSVNRGGVECRVYKTLTTVDAP